MVPPINLPWFARMGVLYRSLTGWNKPNECPISCAIVRDREPILNGVFSVKLVFVGGLDPLVALSVHTPTAM